jgi:hypothetical protein
MLSWFYAKNSRFIVTCVFFFRPTNGMQCGGLIIVNIYDMVWKPFVLGDCVPCAGSRLKNPLSFYCLTIWSVQKAWRREWVPSICFAYQGYILRHIVQITKYYHHLSMEYVCVTSFGQFSLIKTNMCRVKLTVQAPCLFIA